MNAWTAPLGKVFNLYLINQQQISANSQLFGKQGEIIFQQSLFFSQTLELSRRWVTPAGLWHDNNIYSLCLKWVWVSGETDFITYGCVRDGTRWHKVKLSYFHSSNPLFGCSASMLSHLQTLPLDDSIRFSPGVWVCHSANPQSNHNLFFSPNTMSPLTYRAMIYIRYTILLCSKCLVCCVCSHQLSNRSAPKCSGLQAP